MSARKKVASSAALSLLVALFLVAGPTAVHADRAVNKQQKPNRARRARRAKLRFEIGLNASSPRALVYVPRSRLRQLRAAAPASPAKTPAVAGAATSAVSAPSAGTAGADAGFSGDGERKAGAGTLETVVVGVALSGAIALLGLFFVRRRRRDSATAVSAPSAAGSADAKPAATGPSRAGGGLIVLLFAVGLGIALFSVSDTSARSRAPSNAQQIKVIKSKSPWIQLDDSVYRVCPKLGPRVPRPRPKG